MSAMKKRDKSGSKGARKRLAPFQVGMNGKAEMPARPNNGSQERRRSRSDERKSIPPENTVARPHARLAAGWARIAEATEIDAIPRIHVGRPSSSLTAVSQEALAYNAANPVSPSKIGANK